jgi:hypothetical protein
MSTLRRCAALLVLIMVPLSLAAKPKEKVFDASPDKVYAAVLKVIRDHYPIRTADDQHMFVSFVIPISWSTGRLEGTAGVEAEDGKGRLRIVVAGGQGAGKTQDNVIKWVGEELDKKN